MNTDTVRHFRQMLDDREKAIEVSLSFLNRSLCNYFSSSTFTVEDDFYKAMNINEKGFFDDSWISELLDATGKSGWLGDGCNYVEINQALMGLVKGSSIPRSRIESRLMTALFPTMFHIPIKLLRLISENRLSPKVIKESLLELAENLSEQLGGKHITMPERCVDIWESRSKFSSGSFRKVRVEPHHRFEIVNVRYGAKDGLILCMERKGVSYEKQLSEAFSRQLDHYSIRSDCQLANAYVKAFYEELCKVPYSTLIEELADDANHGLAKKAFEKVFAKHDAEKAAIEKANKPTGDAFILEVRKTIPNFGKYG